MDLKEVSCDSRNWMNLVQDRDQGRVYVRAVMTFRVPKGQLVNYYTISRD